MDPKRRGQRQRSDAAAPADASPHSANPDPAETSAHPANPDHADTSAHPATPDHADPAWDAQAPDPVAALRRQATRAIGHLARPRSYAGVAREVALSAVHAGTYPLGLLPGARPRRVARRADADAAADAAPASADTAGTPVVLVHGYVHNRSAFIVMSRALRRAGFQHVRGINYNPLTQDLWQVARHLAAEVDAALRVSGTGRCTIIGHSMGGVVARHYVQLMGGEDTVDTVITLGAPHLGSYTSYVGLGPSAAQLRPGSRYLRHLEATARPTPVRWVAYYSDLDFMVVPAVHAKLVHPAFDAENIRVRDTGHLSMLMSRDVLRDVLRQLTRPSGTSAADAALSDRTAGIL